MTWINGQNWIGVNVEHCAIHGNGRELMHIKVATLGAETLIKV